MNQQTKGKKAAILKHCLRVMHKTGIAFFWVFLICLLGGVSSSAQEKRQGLQLENITVTAQKQKENIQDVPSSVSVIDELSILDKKIESVGNIVDYVPNMMIFNDGMLNYNRMSTRGIAAPTYASSTTSTGLYIDGVPVLGTFGYEDGLVDIERIEVLRGPQGTLYGKNTEAGAINIITRQPTNQSRGNISIQGGQFFSSGGSDKWTGRASLSINGPIQKDRLFFDLAGVYQHKDGFLENVIANRSTYERHRWSGRGKLRWTPTHALDVSLLVSCLSHESDGMNMNLSPGGARMFKLPQPSYRRISSGVDENQEMKINTVALHLAYAITDTLSLTSVTARRETSYDCALDFDFSPITLMDGFQDNTYEKISQELRLNGKTDQWDWLVGLYYDKDDGSGETRTESIMPRIKAFSKVDSDGESYAIFGQIGYHLTDRLKVIGGLRYEYQDMELEGNFPVGRLSDTWRKVSPKIAFEYKIVSDVMTYVSFAQGYRPGGFNTLATDPAYTSYDEETLWSYEIGVKSLLMHKRLMLNAAVFYMDIDDMQVAQAFDPFRSWNTNAAKASAVGAEIEWYGKVTRAFSFMGCFGYTKIEFDQFHDAKGDYKDKKIPYAPTYSFQFGGQYRGQGGFYARADLIGYGKMFFDKSNEYARDAYQVVNAKIGYEAENWDVYLYGQNIFDERYDSVGYFGGFYTRYSDPGELGVQLNLRF